MKMKRIVSSCVLVGVALLLAGCAGRSQTSTSPLAREVGAASAVQPVATFPTRVNDEGQVSVEITPLNLDRPGEAPRFQVTMDTHVVALDYDLAEVAILRTDLGAEVAAERWDGTRGGHHVGGMLYFPIVNLEKAGRIEVVIRDVAGVPERIFNWELP